MSVANELGRERDRLPGGIVANGSNEHGQVLRTQNRGEWAFVGAQASHGELAARQPADESRDIAFHAADDAWRERAATSLPMGKLGQVDEIADFVVFLLSDRSGVVTGSVIDWDQNVFGGLD